MRLVRPSVEVFVDRVLVFAYDFTQAKHREFEVSHEPQLDSIFCWRLSFITKLIAGYHYNLKSALTFLFEHLDELASLLS